MIFSTLLLIDTQRPFLKLIPGLTLLPSVNRYIVNISHRPGPIVNRHTFSALVEFASWELGVSFSVTLHQLSGACPDLILYLQWERPSWMAASAGAWELSLEHQCQKLFSSSEKYSIPLFPGSLPPSIVVNRTAWCPHFPSLAHAPYTFLKKLQELHKLQNCVLGRKCDLQQSFGVGREVDRTPNLAFQKQRFPCSGEKSFGCSKTSQYFLWNQIRHCGPAEHLSLVWDTASNHNILGHRIVSLIWETCHWILSDLLLVSWNCMPCPSSRLMALFSAA